MDGFRYPQFCALARAAEILGERWTLPLLRELFTGPQRFSDLRRRLPGLSSSVLATRLERLEGLGVIRRRTLPPPAASQVYELGDAGRALGPALRELMCWGLRFLGPPRPGDHVEPDWIPLACRLFARRGPTPPHHFELRIGDGDSPLAVHVRGGVQGTRIGDAAPPQAPDAGTTHSGVAADRPDLVLHVPPVIALALVSGRVDGPTWVRETGAPCEGNLELLRVLPRLFEFPASAAPAAAVAADPSPPRPPRTT